MALRVSNPRPGSLRPASLDIFFTSVSSATVSSMSTVEMEVFSNTQLIIITILMLLGGEVLTSIVGFHLSSFKFSKPETSKESRVSSVCQNPPKHSSFPGLEIEKPATIVDVECNINSLDNYDHSLIKSNSIKCLARVALGYFSVVHITGSSLVAMYTSLVPSARQVLSRKGIKIQTFSVLTTVSTFSNCGFVPTNENMAAFRKNSGLLLILIPQILLGNTLYPSCLRFLIWVLEKITRKVEFRYILMNSREMGYGHLLSFSHSCFLAVTVLGFILVEFIIFCSMEWSSGALDGLNPNQKLIGALFQVVNSRHTGESVVDLSIISPAILVLFVVMMYLPPYTSFMPLKQQVISETGQKCKNRRKSLVQCLLFSPLSILVIFVILICVSEREKLKKDPLNFNVLNITIEVISAYGNVGFSTGYSCKRQLEPDSSCKDAWFGFVGRWSNMGKLILILVMFFGRLKKFSINGGKAWKLS
ncbi:SODIUM TRANSPORTER HKT1 [Salix viminalis]|uniref:SODIUM TRANSPORTER HKT1 n=1 Tax=Salix viminalis TaxID=40686 RepID=A0A9Q0NNT2_SALVM|nr:SODIUM TRANSPORTER HKT1 [Salix viminalis]